MRPNLHRGQAPAKGILHTEQRTPSRIITRADGSTVQQSDPRGYWRGQHTNGPRKAWRDLVAAVGRRQALKRVKEQRRG